MYYGLFWGGVEGGWRDRGAGENVGLGHGCVAEGAGFMNVDGERVGEEEVGKFLDSVLKRG